jgi:hypothetical protein
MGPVPRSARRAAGVIALAVALVLVAAPAAFAATYTVGTTSDATGTCANPSARMCSLRQVIAFENASGTNDTIVVPAGSYTLTNGQLNITQSMTIAGTGARITSIIQKTTTSTSRVFAILGNPNSGFTPTVTISGLAISSGEADSTSTPAFFGGNVVNEGTLTLSEDSIENGSTTFGSGAGISNDGGNLTLAHSLVAFNGSSQTNDSGGIQNFGPNPITNGPGNLTVMDSTITNNISAQGGGIFSWCGGTSGSCSASGQLNSVTVDNSTIAHNDGGTRSKVGGGLLTSAGAIELESSIVAFNTVDTPSAGAASNCGTGGSGTIISFFHHNMETGSDCGFNATGDLQNANPIFTSTTPQNNGGNTDTLGLSPTSPAVDEFGERQGCSNGTDQRDIPRPAGLGCDIGAFELVPTYNATEGGTSLSHQLVPTDCPVISMQITWGDGTQSAGTSAGQGTHTYAEEGTYDGSIVWNSDDCGSGNYRSTFVVDVADAPLSATGILFDATAGSTFSGQVATASDADPNGTASDYSATIDWGDGSTTPGTVTPGPGGFQVSGTHNYARGGTYPTTVSIADAGGASTVAHGTATVTSSPTPVVTGSPPSIGGTSAGFTGSVNPSGLPTTASFQYGLDPRYTGGGPIAYTQSTPAQAAGSDFTNHIVTASVTGLVPNATYHVRLVASNSAGTTFGPDLAFNTLMTAPPPPPTLGQTFTISLASGVVLIKVHGVFIPITELRQIPKNTVIDALHGTLTLTIAAPGGPGGAPDAAAKGKKRKVKTEKGTFSGAVFKITQATRSPSKGLATRALVEGAFKGAPTYETCKKHKAADVTAAALSSKTLQLLHASAKGKFRTSGRYAAATVRGTKWTIADRCDGTLTHDITDSVAVTDFVRHKTIILHASQSYLAKKP